MATEKLSVESAETMKTTITKISNVKELATGVTYRFGVEEVTTEGGGFYLFRIKNDRGEPIGMSWLLSQTAVDNIKRLFDWEDR